MRAGDTVRHRPTGETWLVAYVDRERLAWCGWPDGDARVEDCELVEACSDGDHEEALRLVSKSGEGLRRSVCASQLLDLLEARGDVVQIMPVTTVRFEPVRAEARLPQWVDGTDADFETEPFI